MKQMQKEIANMMSEDLPAKPLPTLTKTASYHHLPNLAELPPPPDPTLTPWQRATLSITVNKSWLSNWRMDKYTRQE